MILLFISEEARPETHTKRQATQQGCLPILLGDGDEGTVTVYGEEKNYFVLGRLVSQGRRKSCTGSSSPANPSPTKKRPLSFVFFESSFTLVSTVSRGHPSLDSTTEKIALNNHLISVKRTVCRSRCKWFYTDRITAQ